MRYSIWNGIKNPIGIVQIIHDPKDKTFNCDEFAEFLYQNRYLVYSCDKNNAMDIVSEQYNLPVFLIGIGQAGTTVQNITCNTDIYAGGVSIMAHTPIIKRIGRMPLFRNKYDTAPRTPLLVVGNMGAIRQIQTYINLDYQNKGLHNLNVLIYPGICKQNAFTVIQDDVLNFINNANKKLH
ncbi:MAG: hypothetical protein II208_02780 [Alphaproteobacteria bacterium]|nr:hypothetical protein [Alphaproteobacteria bacterium]